MLARGNRITRGAEYKAVVRGGSRCAGAHTVTYVVTTGESRPPRFGFIVSKQVGGAVVRNTVRRRLKDVCARSLPTLLDGVDVVVRALPSAAAADFAALDRDVSRCLAKRAAA